MDRRSAIKALGILAVAALDGCARQHVARSTVAPPGTEAHLLKLPKVNVQADREIRTVVGLRPFRPSGFVVKAQKLDDKLVVHNYGHGGGGFTLSWGTSELACREIDQTTDHDVAVLGCGVVGLAGARLLQERGRSVTIYATDLPPYTTSNIAGAQWFPAYAFQQDRIAPGFMSQFLEALRIANARFQLMVGPRYGIRWLPNYFMRDEPFHDSGFLGVNGPLNHLVAEMRDLPVDENPFPFRFVRQLDTMMIEPNTYLPLLMEEFRIAGGRIVIRQVHDPAELQVLPERVILNCTGLGAKALFGDEELTPVKGQLSILLPQPEIAYCTIPGDLYMFPRTDGIVLGGTHESGVWTLAPDLQAKVHILAEHARIFQQMKA